MAVAQNLTTAMRRKRRVRNRLRKVSRGRARLTVFRSSKNIYAQIIDDRKGHTLAAASSLERDLGFRGKCTRESAEKIGVLIAQRAREAGVSQVFFDRGGYLFHGRIKALAQAARDGGLEF